MRIDEEDDEDVEVSNLGYTRKCSSKRLADEEQDRRRVDVTNLALSTTVLKPKYSKCYGCNGENRSCPSYDGEDVRKAGR